MDKRSLLFAALALGAACKYTSAFADDDGTDSHLGAGIHDVTDPELSTMRGRYVVGDNTVVWFGVEMISTMQTSNGQLVQSTLTLSMNFSKSPSSPQVSFVPTVTITTPDAALPAVTVQPSVNRSVQSGGLANVGGLVQSVQIAGDNNAAANVTSLNIQSGGNAPSTSSGSNGGTTETSDATAPSSPSTASVATGGPGVNTSSTTTPIATNSNTTHSSLASTSAVSATTVNTGASTTTGRTASVGDASASSTYANNEAEVTTSVLGQGSASQWIRAGSLGQTIALTTDNAVVTNQMIVNLVTQQLSSSAQLAHTLAQSMNLSHLNGH